MLSLTAPQAAGVMLQFLPVVHYFSTMAPFSPEWFHRLYSSIACELHRTLVWDVQGQYHQQVTEERTTNATLFSHILCHQGEMVQAKFGIPAVAQRQLEIYTTAVLLATRTPPKPPRLPIWRSLMDELSSISCSDYRSVRPPILRIHNPAAKWLTAPWFACMVCVCGLMLGMLLYSKIQCYVVKLSFEQIKHMSCHLSTVHTTS